MPYLGVGLPQRSAPPCLLTGDAELPGGRSRFLKGQHRACQTLTASMINQHAISGNQQVVCALLQDGRIQCWGDNGNGEIGLGDNTGANDLIGENEVPSALTRSALSVWRKSYGLSGESSSR